MKRFSASLAGGTAAVLFAWAAAGTAAAAAQPDPAGRQAAVDELRRAAQAHGVCYGWSLSDASSGLNARPVTVGSNLGDGTAVDNDPGQCPRWVKLDVTYQYTDESSEDEDTVQVSIESSRDLSGRLPTADALTRLGIDNAAFLDDPETTILRGAMTLPLLVTGAGMAGPVPRASAPPTTPVAPLEDVGSDFWRDRWPWVAAAVALVALAIAGVGIGWWQRRRTLTRRAELARQRAAAQGGLAGPGAPPNGDGAASTDGASPGGGG